MHVVKCFSVIKSSLHNERPIDERELCICFPLFPSNVSLLLIIIQCHFFRLGNREFFMLFQQCPFGFCNCMFWFSGRERSTKPGTVGLHGVAHSEIGPVGSGYSRCSRFRVLLAIQHTNADAETRRPCELVCFLWVWFVPVVCHLYSFFFPLSCVLSFSLFRFSAWNFLISKVKTVHFRFVSWLPAIHEFFLGFPPY